jgi:hypothetical protein
MKKSIILFLLLIAVNANAAKMAYFRGVNSYLTVPHSSYFEFDDYKDWKVKWKIKSDNNTDVQAIWGSIAVFVTSKYDGTHMGEFGFDTQGMGLPQQWAYSGMPVCCDNVIHTCEIRYTASTHTLEWVLDDVVLRSESSHRYSWNDAIYWAQTHGVWIIGASIEEPPPNLPHYINVMNGFVSEFEVWGNGVLKLYLPLTDDLLDHSGNNVPVTVNNVDLRDADGVYSGGAVETLVANSGGNWTLMPQAVIFAGNLTSAYGITKTGAVIYCENLNLVTTGKKLKTAELVVTYTDIGGGLGLGGAGVKAKIRAQNTANPADVTDANDFIASAKTEAYVEIDQTYTNGQPVVYDISSIITELLAYGNLSRINLIYDDNDGRTSLTDGCYIGTNYSVYIELEDMGASSSTGLRVPWKH